MAKRIVFRADASTEIGLGHVMRCLTLADELRARGGDIAFICREHAGFLPRLITDRGYGLSVLPPPAGGQQGPADLAHGNWLGVSLEQEIAEVKALLQSGTEWLVTDHYAIDRRWQQAIRPLAKKIMVIDDLADRPHDCHLLLDQTLGRQEEEYARLTPPGTRLLLGSRYALLRPNFANGRAASLAWRQNHIRPERIVVSMGGVDRANFSARILDALAGCSEAALFHVTVILGPAAPWRDVVAEHAAKAPFPVELAIDPPDIATLLARSDLAVGGGGGGAWERCALGLPSVIVVMADNQVNGARQLEDAGASITIGASDDLKQSLPAQIEKIVRDGMLPAMSKAAAAIVDGLGAPRVASEMESENWQ